LYCLIIGIIVIILLLSLLPLFTIISFKVHVLKVSKEAYGRKNLSSYLLTYTTNSRKSYTSN